MIHHLVEQMPTVDHAKEQELALVSQDTLEILIWPADQNVS